MAQYDVYANPSTSAATGIPYVVVIQSDFLDAHDRNAGRTADYEYATARTCSVGEKMPESSVLHKQIRPRITHNRG